jgi:signal transduction histidine kinase
MRSGPCVTREVEDQSTLRWRTARSPRGYRAGVDRPVPRISDAMVPLALAILATLEPTTRRGMDPGVALVLIWLACGALMFRSALPVGAPSAALAFTAIWFWVGPGRADLAAPFGVVVFATYSLAAHPKDLRGLVPFVTFVVAILVQIGFEGDLSLSEVLYVSIVAGAPFLFGRVVRSMGERNRLLKERAQLLAARHESARREAIAVERARLHRELHDVIAHSITSMTVQAAAAEDLLDSDPAAAQTAIRSIQATGRDALMESGALLGVVGGTTDDAYVAGIARTDLDGLVQRFVDDGLAVDLMVKGDVGELPRLIEVSCLRIVRELLTNALRYASDRRVRLAIDIGDSTVEITTQNRSAPDGALESGHRGLIGIRERAAAHGGAMMSGRRGDRFVVRVRLPIGEATH